MRARSTTVLVTLSLVGCSVSASDVQKEFSKKYSCPMGQITVTKRPDVDAGEFEKTPTPPPDIAADPARLAVWQANHQPKPWNADFFELAGCGHHVLWGCVLPGKQSSVGAGPAVVYERDLDEPATSSTKRPPGVAAGAPNLVSGPVILTWNAHIERSTGDAPKVGTACTLTAVATARGASPNRERVTFKCQDRVLYDSLLPIHGQSESTFDLRESTAPGGYTYTLVATDTSTPPRPQLSVASPQGTIDVWADAGTVFRVHAKVDVQSTPRDGKPLRSDTPAP